MRIRGLKKKLYRFAYDKPKINRKVLQVGRSIDEVRKQLGEKKKK